MKFLLAFIFLFSQTTYGQTVGRNIEFNSVSGADYYTNFVINESAKKNTANTVTSSATVARGTTNKIDNVASFTVDASAQNGYVEFTLGTIYDPATSGNCEFKGVFKGDGTLYKAQIVDGSGNLLNQTSVLTNETNWRAFSVVYPCAASGSRKVRITQTESGTAPAFSVGKLYYGQITNLQAGVPNNVFSAKISSAGVVSDENEDFISGNCAMSGSGSATGLCTLVTSKFSVAPTCTITPSESSVSVTVSLFTGWPTTSGIKYYGSNVDTGSNAASAINITCTRSSTTDFIQPAITADQWDFDWKNYTPSIAASTGTFPTYTLNYAHYARLNGKLYARGRLTFTNTNTWATPVITIPSGLSHTGGRENVAGKVIYTDNGNNSYGGTAYLQGSGNILLGSSSGTNGAGISVSQSSPFTWASTDFIEWFVGPIDIIGWTNSQNAPMLVQTVYADTTIKAEKSAGLTSVDYGTYSATVTAGTNATSVTSPATCNYMRIGSVVSGSCRISAGCTTAAGAATTVTVTVPIATTQASTISGTIGSNITTESGRVIESGSNIGMNFACGTTGATTRTMNFQYQVP